MKNYERHVFPTRLEIGIAPRQGVVGLSFWYKLSPDEPEEFQQRYALTIEQATSIGQNLLDAVRKLENLPQP